MKIRPIITIGLLLATAAYGQLSTNLVYIPWQYDPVNRTNYTHTNLPTWWNGGTNFSGWSTNLNANTNVLQWQGWQAADYNFSLLASNIEYLGTNAAMIGTNEGWRPATGAYDGIGWATPEGWDSQAVLIGNTVGGSPVWTSVFFGNGQMLLGMQSGQFVQINPGGTILSGGAWLLDNLGNATFAGDLAVSKGGSFANGITSTAVGPLTLLTNATPPASTILIKAWVTVTNQADGSVWKMPLYQ